MAPLPKTIAQRRALQIYVSDELLELLQEIEDRGLDRADAIREGVRMYLENQDHKHKSVDGERTQD
jgi:metal-responsive CopG/Arc/MetJ family transcriptional regulator